MIIRSRTLDPEKRPHRMPQDRRAEGRTSRSTPRIGPCSLPLPDDEPACGSCRSRGKRQTVSHSSLDGADAVHRLHRLNDKRSLKPKLDRHGGTQAS
jgi:hypothetical protein